MTGKVEMIMADPDASYMKLIAAYIRQSRWAEQLDVKWFTQQDSFMEEMGKQSQASRLVIVHRGWLPEKPMKEWVVLEETESERSMDKTTSSEPQRLFKYQPIERLLTTAMGFAEVNNSRDVPGARFSTKQMKVISFVSAAGGTGKTTAAYQLVRLLGSKGRRSLLVNLEPICSLLKPDPDYSRLFGQYLYYSRAGSPKAIEWVKKLIRRHPLAPLDILGGSGAFREMEELTSEDIERLMDHIRTMGLYRSAIVDLDSGVNPSVKGAMAASDSLICMLTEDASAIRKTAEFLNACPKWLEMESETIRSKLCLMFNRWKGESHFDFRTLGLAIAAKLPEVPQWKLSPAWELEQVDPHYERSLVQLAEALHLDGSGVGHASTA